MQPVQTYPEKRYLLPPLILHPFSDVAGPNKLVESSRATLMLQGLLPTGDLTREDLDRTLLQGRYCEIRMLFYVGKDLTRWIEQCLELVEREDELRGTGVQFQSFAALLVEDPPPSVREKLKKWGVADYKAIFSRAIGLNAIFQQAPDREHLTDDFIRNYYRYADHLFSARQRMSGYTPLVSENFEFQLYASGEYSRMLEQQWESDSGR
jgi:hypothetical protein